MINDPPPQRSALDPNFDKDDADIDDADMDDDFAQNKNFGGDGGIQSTNVNKMAQPNLSKLDSHRNGGNMASAL